MTPERTKKLLPVMRAFSEEKAIEQASLSYNPDKWTKTTNPQWENEDLIFRIKPWSLADVGDRPLEPGEKWHREDWTEDMLKEGERPLLLGEEVMEGDAFRHWASGWRLSTSCVGLACGSSFRHSKTSRHLPPPPKLELSQPPEGHELHNPDGLTAEQVGKDYRLLVKAEIRDRAEKVSNLEIWNEEKWMVGFYGNMRMCCYRLPISTALMLPEPKDKEYEEVNLAMTALCSNDEFKNHSGNWETIPQIWVGLMEPHEVLDRHYFRRPILKQKPKWIPLVAGNIPPNSALRWPAWAEDVWTMIQDIDHDEVRTRDGFHSYKKLMDEGVLILLPGTSEWKPCRKEAV